MDENGIVIKNKARLVAQSYNQQEGIDYEETFALVARLEAIRIFLAYAAYMGFMVYQIDIKSVFLNGKISKEVYVQQPPGFGSSEFPNHVCKLDKALYGLKQAPRAWSQANPKESHLVAVKRISDYAGCNLDRKSTSRGCQILRGKLVYWSAKKQSSMAMSSAEAEYVAAVLKSFGSRVSWLTMMFSMTRGHILKGDIELHFVPTHLQLADIFTKPLAEPSFTRLVAELGMLNIEKQVSDKKMALDEFISAIGLPIYKDIVPLPPKETVRAGLATLGLFDKDKPTLSSTVLGSHDQMNLNQQTIAYCLIWGLEIDIRAIIFSDLVYKLQNRKKNRELNICYTRFLSLIFEKLLGGNYISNDLSLVKPHTITAASFQKPLASEVPLTSHMIKVAKLSEEPGQSLIPPSGEVNADDMADKSLSRAYVQPVTQPKAPTDLKTKKKRIPPFSKPKSPDKVRVILLKKQVDETQHAKVIVATADDTKSLVASELAEEQVNQPLAAEAEKVLDQNVEDEVKDTGFVAMEDDQHVIDITPKDAEEGDASDSLSSLRSMPDDDLAFITSSEIQDSAD
ncbi:retrovirus-related pol polyprotein from transposon TNT 1-94 [Tanacetum coccineum]